ncbi:3-hydroxyacyl-CoA dehydrogenase family protein [Halobacteriovorax marinus]|uniref:3-hydroxyacyl-CoA dehydrogenase family protein n=1 Tax=Halobacteriovorax marinus TaxID=97084 RepID=UPI003A8F6428
MTTNKKFLVLATKNHPFYHKLKESDVIFYDLESHAPFEEKWSHYMECDLVLDFTVIEPEKKFELLKHLNIQFDFPIVSDLSTYWGELFLEKISGLRGAISLNFPSPTNCYEYYAIDERTNSGLTDFFELIGCEGLRVACPGVGFTYPRVISMIINEAYFSLEDQLARPKDIDTAMKFGVNYPMGPFEWAQKIGHKNILRLLEELYKVTGDPRYRPSQKLRLEANLI